MTSAINTVKDALIDGSLSFVTFFKTQIVSVRDKDGRRTNLSGKKNMEERRTEYFDGNGEQKMGKRKKKQEDKQKEVPFLLFFEAEKINILIKK